jgi:hypothetical protein
MTASDLDLWSLKQEEKKVAYAHRRPGALGLESLEQEEQATYTHCCPGALGLESLEQEEKAA